MGGWDRGIPFRKAERIILKEMAKTRESDLKAYCYWSIALIQLKNGARISEAIEGFKKALASNSRKVEVRVRKSKDEYRLIIIPKVIELKPCRWLLEESDRAIRERVRVYLWRKGLNSHSLRYAFITELSSRGLAPQLIASITRHKDLDMITHYVQKREAEDILELIAST